MRKSNASEMSDDGVDASDPKLNINVGDNDDELENQEAKIRVSLTLAAGVRNRESLEVPSEPLAVPASIRKKGLSAVVNHLLDREVEHKDGSEESDSNSYVDNKLPAIPFDFLLNDKLLRMSLESAARKEGLNLEHAVELHYFPARLPPRKQAESECFPDWISAMDFVFGSSTNSGASALFTGGCDGVVRIFRPMNTGDGLQRATSVVAHTGPIKCLSSAGKADHMLVATGSMDQTLVTHIYQKKGQKDDPDYNLSLHAVYSGGHSNSISSVALSTFPTSNQRWLMASADWDGGLAIWQVPTVSVLSNESDVGNNKESSKKRLKADADSKSKSFLQSPAIPVQEVTPLQSIAAHSSNISGISWGSEQPSDSNTSQPTTLITGSWDHGLKVWDVERSDCILALNGSRVVTALSRCVNSDVVATAHPDYTLRLWDMRTYGGGNSSWDKQSSQISDRTLKQSHKAWVSNVRWSPVDPFVLATTSHDGTLKVWDIRSSLPLHTVKAVDKKQDKALCLAFGDGVLYTGGSDCVVKRFVCSV